MWLFYSEKLQFQVASRALAVGSWKESFLTADFADVRGWGTESKVGRGKLEAISTKTKAQKT
jgi:hypothetical protein